MAWLLANTFTLVVILTTALCKPYGLSVSDIRATSVVLHWHSTETTVEEFKIQCTGTSQYKTENEEQVTDVDTVTHYAPKGSDHVLIGNMKENFNYSCIVTEDIDKGSQILGSRASDPYWFATDYGVPEQPKSPAVHIKDHVVTIELFQSSTKFGPIHGYEVQFHLVNGWTSDGQPFIDSEDMVVGQLMSMEEAQASIDPVPFKISYNSSILPDSVTINEDLLNGALKNSVMYTVITVAYTIVEENNNGSTVLSTESMPSTSFTAIGLASTSSLGLQSGSSGQLILAIGLGVAFPLAVLGYFFCVGAFIYCREMRLRKQKAFTRSDIINARRTQQQENPSWFRATTEGDLPWLDPLIGNSNQQTSLLEHPQQNSSNNESTMSVIAEVQEPSRGCCSNNSYFSNNSNEINDDVNLLPNAAGANDIIHDVSGTGEQETIIIIQNEVESEKNIGSTESQCVTLSIEPESTMDMDESTNDNTSMQGTSASGTSTFNASGSMEINCESHCIVTISEEELSSIHVYESTSSNPTNERQSYVSTDSVHFSSQQNKDDESTNGSVSEVQLESKSSLFRYKATPVLIISPDSSNVSQTQSSILAESRNEHSIHSNSYSSCSTSGTDPNYSETADLSTLNLMSSKSSVFTTTTPSPASSETTIFSQFNPTRLEPESDNAMYCILSTDCCIHGPIISSSSMSQSNGSVQILFSCPDSSQPYTLDTEETQSSVATSDIRSPSHQDSMKLSSSSGDSSSIHFKPSLFASTPNGSKVSWCRPSVSDNKASLPSSVSEYNLSQNISTMNSGSANLISTPSCNLSPDSSTSMLNHHDSNSHPHIEEYLKSESSEQFTDSLKLEMSLSTSQQHDESTLFRSHKSRSSILSQHSSTPNPFLLEGRSSNMSNPSVLSIASSNSGLSYSTSTDYHSALECSGKPHCLCGTTHEHGTTNGCIHDQTSNHSNGVLNGNHSSSMHLTSSSDSFFVPRLLSCKSLNRVNMVPPDTPSSTSLTSFHETADSDHQNAFV